MRNDEEFAKDSILTYLRNIGTFSISSKVGEDPPDYYLNFDTKNIALEITTAPSVFGEESKKTRRSTATESLISLLDKANEKFKEKIPSGESLLLTIKVPIKNYANFKTSLFKHLEELDVQSVVEERISLSGEEIVIKKIVHNDLNRKALIGIIGVKNPILDVDYQVSLILEKILSEKTRKMISISGEKWLGIINAFPIANIDNFKSAYSKVHVNHDFRRVFVIEQNSDVYEFTID